MSHSSCHRPQDRKPFVDILTQCPVNRQDFDARCQKPGTLNFLCSLPPLITASESLG
jgi:hypothetical protein